MKAIYLTIFMLITALSANSQAPERMSYQAVISGSDNKILVNKLVGIKFSIIRDSPSGTTVYAEQQTATTSEFGQISVQIGGGAVIAGSFSNINWETGPYFLKTEIDPYGGTSYSISGSVQFVSVPYAMYASSSGNSQPGAPGDKGPDGDPGQPGESAYDIWLSLGNTGSKQDFINWLKGPKGPDGMGSGNDFTHFIGEEYGGGVIFHLWLDNNGIEHGLIIDKNDLSTNTEFSNFYKSTSAATSFWDGEANTNAILEEADYNPCAALLCALSTNGGYSDWYIPAMDEMSLVYRNLFTVNKALGSLSDATPIPIGKNANLSEYWLSNSNESESSQAYTFRFALGDYNVLPKIFSKRLRAIRKF